MCGGDIYELHFRIVMGTYYIRSNGFCFFFFFCSGDLICWAALLLIRNLTDGGFCHCEFSFVTVNSMKSNFLGQILPCAVLAPASFILS